MRTTSEAPLGTEEFYDILAKTYDDTVTARRKSYLDAVDDLVITSARELNPEAYLDVGCGDGRRTHKIAVAMGATTVVGLDLSRGMLTYAPKDIETRHGSILELEDIDRFDVVTALWSVLCHLPNPETRVEAFARASKAMRTGGKFFFDVNNGFNSRAYGEEVVESNKRILENSGVFGDITYDYEVDGRTVTARSHVYYPEELDDLIAAVPGLSVTNRVFIDYDTGESVGSPSDGQIFYELTKD